MIHLIDCKACDGDGHAAGRLCATCSGNGKLYVEDGAAVQLMTASRFRCKQRCDRLHFFKYELGIRPRKKSAPLRFGSLFHESTDPWWRAHKDRKPDQALDHALDAMRTHRPDEMDDYRFTVIERLIRGYDAFYGPAMDRIEVLEVEAEFRAPLLHPRTGDPIPGWRVSGKIDVIVAGGGTIVGIETKTSAADLGEGAFYWAKLAMDPQLSAYFDGAKSLVNGRSYELDRFCYDVIAKPKTKRYKATAEIKMTKGKACGTKTKPCPGRSCETCEGTGWREQPRPRAGQRTADETVEEYGERITDAIIANPEAWYHRYRVPRTDQDMADHRREFARAAVECSTFDVPADWCDRADYGRADIEHLSMRYWPPPRNTHACAQGSSVCEFFDVCQGARFLDDPRFVQAGPHPELKQGEKQ